MDEKVFKTFGRVALILSIFTIIVFVTLFVGAAFSKSEYAVMACFAFVVFLFVVYFAFNSIYFYI
mgnify:CR=1 FL=1